MNVKMIAAVLAAAPLLAFAQGAAKDSAKPTAKGGSKDAMATVNGVAVLQSRADFILQQQKARGAPDNDQLRAQIREDLINREVLAQEAARSGIAKTPAVITQLDFARQSVIIDAYVQDWLKKNPISEADIQKAYDQVKAQQGDKEYRARHILVETEDQAKTMVAELKKGGKFEDLAAKNSKDPGSKDRGGDLDWHGPGDFDRAFSEAMMKLDKGKFTDTPVRTRFGFHIIQLDDVRTGRFPSLAEVKPRIQQQLAQIRIDELVKGLRAKAKVE